MSKFILLLSLFFFAYNIRADQPDWIDCLNLPEPIEVGPVTEILHNVQCSEKKKAFADGISNLKDDSEIYRALSLRKPDIWLIGDSHNLHSLKYAKDILNNLHDADPKINCLFDEFSPGNEGRIDGLIANPPKSIFSNDYAQIYKQAHDLNFKIIFVDKYMSAYFDANHDPNFKEYKYQIYVRNKGMADEIKKAMDEGKCTGGVYIVGKAHIFSTDGSYKIKSIKQFLQDANLKVVSVNIVQMWFNQSDKDTTAPNEYDYFQDSCRPTMPVNLTNVKGFLNTTEHIDIPLFDFGGSMNDFDATLFQPGPAVQTDK